MSDGKTHARITTILTVPVAVGTFVYSGDVATAVSAFVGCSFNIVCGPDLDQQGITRNETALLHSWAMPIGIVWVMIWFPYAVLIPHRSPLSHFPIMGTVLRDAYIFAWVWVLAQILFDAGTAVVDFFNTIPDELLISFLIGQIIADSGHYVADVLHSARVKMFKKKKKKGRK